MFLTIALLLWGVAVAFVTTGLPRIFPSVGQEGNWKLVHGLIKDKQCICVRCRTGQHLSRSSVSVSRSTRGCSVLLLLCSRKSLENVNSTAPKSNLSEHGRTPVKSSPYCTPSETNALLNWSKSCAVMSLPFTGMLVKDGRHWKTTGGGHIINELWLLYIH